LNESGCTTEEGLRRELVRFSRWLSRIGFTPGTSGNLSVRLDSRRLLVTPTGVSKGLVKASDMVIVDLHGRQLAGSRKVTSEISMHLAVYGQRQDVGGRPFSSPNSDSFCLLRASS
jgi:L-fuculose-phosphate aldolase